MRITRRWEPPVDEPECSRPEDGGPWRGPTEREWVERISAGALATGGWSYTPAPWVRRPAARLRRRGE